MEKCRTKETSFCKFLLFRFEKKKKELVYVDCFDVWCVVPVLFGAMLLISAKSLDLLMGLT